MNMAGNVEATAYWPGVYLSSQISMIQTIARFSCIANLFCPNIGRIRDAGALLIPSTSVS